MIIYFIFHLLCHLVIQLFTLLHIAVAAYFFSHPYDKLLVTHVASFEPMCHPCDKL